MKEYALRLGDWLVSEQRESGGYLGAFGLADVECYFDTAQVLRGLLSLTPFNYKYVDSAKKAAVFLCEAINQNSNEGFPVSYNANHESICPESAFLYALKPLITAGEMFDRFDFIEASHNAADYYTKKYHRFMSLDTITHFLAYEIDGLIEIGRQAEVIEILKTIAESQRDDGAIPAKKEAQWVCVPGVAQLAICWYKVGMKQYADKAMNWLDSHQKPSGGFLGSIGQGSTYYFDDELSWGVKFYLDAYRWRIRRFFDDWSKVADYSDLSDDSFQLTAVRDILNNVINYTKSNKICIVDIGCGKGRFIRGLMRKYPDCTYIGVDLSDAMLEGLPNNVSGIRGELENIPLCDNTADFVYSNECIEHSINLSGGVFELARICKPGGTIVIIDKGIKQWGKYNCPPWERWFTDDAVTLLLKKYCDEVSCEDVHNPNNLEIGLWKIWTGKKRW